MRVAATFSGFKVWEGRSDIAIVAAHKVGGEQVCTAAARIARILCPIPIVQRQIRIDLAQKRFETVYQLAMPYQEAGAAMYTSTPAKWAFL